MIWNSLLIVWLSLQLFPTHRAPLRKVTTIELPGPRGEHFDHLAMDYDDHYLLSAHLGPGILYLIDTRTNTLIKSIHGLSGITAPVYVPRLRKVYTCDWGENKIGVVSLDTMGVIKKLPTREKPNGGVYAEPVGKVYISDTLGKEVAVVDVHRDVIVKEVKFDSETGMVQFDPVGLKVLVNLRSRGDRSCLRHNPRAVPCGTLRFQSWNGARRHEPTGVPAVRRKQCVSGL